MTQASVKESLNSIPVPLQSGRLENIFPNWSDDSPYKRPLLEIVDSYRSWDQVEARIVHTGHGHLLRITDTYLPPSQTDKAPKLKRLHVPGGYIPKEIDARVPSSVVFDFWDSSAGQLSAEYFNQSGPDHNLSQDNPHLRIAAEWRKRMGVESSYGWYPRISMGEKGNFAFADLGFNNGMGRFENFSPLDVLDMGYAVALLAHHLPHIPTQEGNFFS